MFTLPFSRPPLRRSWVLSCLLAGGLALHGLPAASQITPVSWAFGERVHLQTIPLLGGGIVLKSLPQPVANVVTAGSQSVSSPRALLTTLLTGNILTTGLLSARAKANDRDSGSAGADASVLNLRLRLPGALPILTVSADGITSAASLSGVCTGDVIATGSSGLQGLTLGGLLGSEIRIPSSPPPNTVLLDTGGIRVIVNEQIFEIADDAPVRFTVNAFHLSASDAASALGLLSGEVIIAQSHTAVTCGEDAPLPSPRQD
jgi:hypothetical protein